MRGSDARNSTRRGHLYFASCASAVREQLVGERVVGRATVDRLHDRDDRLAPFGVGQPDDRDVADRRVRRQHRFDLLGVHVHTAGDDHVLGAVADEEIAVVVDESDVADGEEPPAVRGARRLRVADVLERRRVGSVVDPADLARPQLATVVVEDGQAGAPDRAPDGAGLLQPPVRLGDRRRTLHAAVGLPDHRAPPLHHPALHLERARRRRMHDRMQARDVGACPHLLRQLQQPMELRRHHVRREHAVLLDEAQGLRGVEAVHDHEPVPDVERARPVGVAAAVVHGGRHEVRPAEGHEVEGAAEGGGVVRHLRGVAVRLRPADALRPAGGPRRVDEQRPRRALGRCRRRVRRPRVRERLEPLDGSGGERGLQHADVDRRHLCRVALVGHQDGRVGVPDDRGDLGLGEQGVERDEVPARLVARQRPLDQPDAVGQERGDGVTRLQHRGRGAGARAGARARRARRTCTSPSGDATMAGRSGWSSAIHQKPRRWSHTDAISGSGACASGPRRASRPAAGSRRGCR